MNANNVKQKYIGLQTKIKKSGDELKLIGEYGCLFLSLCSIAEEYNESHHSRYRVDIIADYIACRSRGFIGNDVYIKDSLAVLNYITGKTWTREIRWKLPDNIPENMYTVEHWFSDKTGYDHFRRRWGDTLDSSNTVRNGVLKEYYCYIVQED